MTINQKEVSSHEKSRDKGLVRAVGVSGLAASIVNCVIGAGIFSLPSSMAREAGGLAPMAFIICAFAMASIVICSAEASSRVATSGGSYGYVEAAFGPFWGLLTGVFVWVAAVLACGGIVSAFGDGMAALLPQYDAQMVRNVSIVLSISIIALINILGVEMAARFITFATLIKIIPLLIFVIFGGFYLINSPQPQAIAPHTDGFGRAIILALFAFSGMETPLGASGEVKNPQKTIPRAIFISMGFILVLYISIQLVAQGLMGSGLAASKSPLADGIAKVFVPFGFLLLVGATISRLFWLLSDVFGAPRVLFAFARDGSLPKFLGAVHSKYHTPHIAIIFHSALGIMLALTGTFEDLAVLSALATAGLYFLTCSAAWKLWKEKIAIFGSPMNFKFLPIASVIGMISMVGSIALAEPKEIIALFAVIVSTSLIYYILKTQKQKA